MPLITALPPTYRFSCVEIPPVTLKAPEVMLVAVVLLLTVKSEVLSISKVLPEYVSKVLTFNVDIKTPLRCYN